MAENPSADSMMTNSTAGSLWNNIARIYPILRVAGISIVMVLLSWVLLFWVEPAKDAIIALGNFGFTHHFVIFCIIGTLWAFLIWYWTRVFYFIEFIEPHKQPGLKHYEQLIIKYTPDVLGALALLIIGFAFLRLAPQCQIGTEPNPIRIMGIVFLILTVLFPTIVNWVRVIFKIQPLELEAPPPPEKRMVTVIELPDTTKRILIITTIIVIILLVALIISPIALPRLLGDAITMLFGCFCIWLPVFYWIHYFSLKLRFPLFLVLAIVIAVFSFFNGNADVRLMEATRPDSKMDLFEYYQHWESSAHLDANNQKPLIIVLSEGGGIRAAYWSAQMLARLQGKFPGFRDNLFCISGVSGGSFGATVFDSLLRYYGAGQDKWEINEPQKIKNQKGEDKRILISEAQQKVTAIAGKDFLSPLVTCMLTRGVIQLLIPVPIPSFDNAKIFEKTWELYWQEAMGVDDEHNIFSQPFLALGPDKPVSIGSTDTPAPTPPVVPALFLNVTQVETGYPVVVSNLRLYDSTSNKSSASENSQAKVLSAGNPEFTEKDNQPKYNLPRDFYNDILKKVPNPAYNDVRVSTASLLSARFPYFSPAGTLHLVRDGATSGGKGADIGLVDGGLFENTGANTAYQVLISLEAWSEKYQGGSIFKKGNVAPVIIYLHNGEQFPDKTRIGQTMLYQLVAPLEAMMQQKDSQTANSVLRLAEFVDFYGGEFIMYSLQRNDSDQPILPLSWALSRKAQDYIVDRVAEIVDEIEGPDLEYFGYLK
jgi:hypothetical protein